MNAWSNKELVELSRLSERFKHTDLCIVMGRTYGSIRHGIKLAGIKSPFNKSGNKRQFYAEDIANIFELKQKGFDFYDIAKCFNSSHATVRRIYNNAKIHGFDKHPKRN